MKNYICCAFAVVLLLNCSEMEVQWEKSIDILGAGNYSITDISLRHGVYVTGTYWTEDRGPFCITAQYNESGEVVWYAEYGPAGVKATYGRKVLPHHSVAGRNEGVFVHAQVIDSAGYINSALIRYDSLGDIMWVRMAQKAAEESERESMMLVDYDGGIYLAGLRADGDGNISIFVSKYDRDGETMWSTSYLNPDIQFRHIKCDVRERGQFALAGVLEDSRDFGLVRYDDMGHVTRYVRFETSEQEEMLADIEIDPNGTVYMTGMSFSDMTHNDFLTVVYDRENTLLWTQRCDGAGHLDDIPRGMAIDESLHVYVTGSSVNERGIPVIVTVKYDRDGNELWRTTYSRKEGEPAEPHFLDAGFIQFSRGKTFENFAITGTVGDDIVLLSHSTNGFVRWAKVYKPHGKKNRPTALSGNCIAVESITTDKTQATIVKYTKAKQFGIARWD
ncbi:hypothetical protein AMJ87_01100 [candidate division WOR_3 bacterium SM23_60]|uniref:Bulb-type lectin domain-containing protein n=1 Tax=candidate division WOR_3 bacterium SM23_60 TaxID=1703780 RepID=A0A0S8GPT5_UNCW3|nr:MAG: hypothetical protein AMJ87_01100 [candidate division WOR_3 bacterium SM23_60]